MKKITILLAVISLALFTGCTKDSESNAAANPSVSRGGSMARFAITQNALYVVDNSSVKVFDITNPQAFIHKTTLFPGMGVLETVFIHEQLLFIGSQIGMYVYDIQNPHAPRLLGKAEHLRSCDPVVANSHTAFVTLRSGAPCGTATDGLYIYNIANNNILNPQLIKTYALPSPYGLGLNGNILYVCQASHGMQVIDVTNPSNPVMLLQIPGNGCLLYTSPSPRD